ncbi:MAG: hypothetical protein Q9191_005147 [Dirinaria sp. TL-2023a]
MDPFGYVQPNAYAALRLPSEALQLVQLVPNTYVVIALVSNHFIAHIVSIGKYGSFQANHVIGRPYYLTFELLDHGEKTSKTGLRVVSAAELYAKIDEENANSGAETGDDPTPNDKDGTEYEVVGENGEVVLRTNRGIIDDPKSQTMTMDEIEALKAEGTGSGRDLIAKILDSHVALDQKTAYALAKYTLRKTRKFLRSFTVLPLDVPSLARFVLNGKEPMKIMELREETLALLTSLSNVHCIPDISEEHFDRRSSTGNVGGRWLTIDETAGLLVAGMAEKMGVLHELDGHEQGSNDPGQLCTTNANVLLHDDASKRSHASQSLGPSSSRKSVKIANGNTITIVHANSQPNLALLRYFGFDFGNPSVSHPLYRHLRTITWLQLLVPEEDLGYMEPDIFPEEVIQSWKSGRRGNYYRKRRRWERIKSTVDQTRDGEFDGLVVASAMSLVTILQHTVPLLRGGAPIVVYSPNIEPLTELADLYSSGRRSAFTADPPDPDSMPTKDFPVNPTFLLATTIHTVRSRAWQVLPGRTHPLMSDRGGSEGYIFSATRAIPAEGKVEARGKQKRRKVGDGDSSTSDSREIAIEGHAVVPETV